MTPETRAQLIAANEDVLETHLLTFRFPRRWVCTGCEWTCETGYDPQAHAEHRHHLADLLTDAVLAHRESIVCPTCGGSRLVENGATERGVLADPCPDCTDGTILGPTVLVERAEYEAEYEVLGYIDDPVHSQTKTFHTATLDVEDGMFPMPGEVLFVRRSDQEET